jgi:hypothetical protein
VRRAHDGHREVDVPVGLEEAALARDLVPGVLPERVLQRCRLGDGQGRGRLLVGGGGRDEDVLPGPAGEPLDVGVHVLTVVGQELGDDVEPAIPQRGVHGVPVPQVRGDGLHLVRQIPER